MAAVVIVTVLAAASLPSISERLRERRVAEVAQNIAIFYRQARMRAIGRGAAQMVQFTNAPIAQGQFVLFEGVQPLVGGGSSLGNCGNLPQSGAYSCLNTDWTTGSPGARFVSSINPTANTVDVFADAQLDNMSVSALDICFSPSSRAYFRQGGGAWQPLMTVPKFQVSRTVPGPGSVKGLIRELIIPPNGGARLVL